jgi:hypothetical protein
VLAAAGLMTPIQDMIQWVPERTCSNNNKHDDV